MKKRTKIQADVSPSLLKKVKILLAAQGRTIKDLINELLEDWVKKQENGPDPII